jgi:hypothetical protein
LTLEKAISLARQSEAVKKQQPLIRGQIEPEANLDAVKSRYKNKQQSTFQRKTAPRQQQAQKQHSGKYNRCGRSPTHNRNNCPARNATCHKCSKKGHYAFICKSRSTVREVKDYSFLGEINSNDSEPWIINLKVKDTDIQFKIDTGADLSVVPEYVFKKSDVKNVDTVQEQYSELFSGLGKTNWEYTIKLKPGYVPFALSTPRRVPLPLMEKVKKEFQRMENMGVISRVDKPTNWCSGMVVVPKSDGSVRICVDLTKVNESVLRENFSVLIKHLDN